MHSKVVLNYFAPKYSSSPWKETEVPALRGFFDQAIPAAKLSP